jgi:hypothetical protein
MLSTGDISIPCTGSFKLASTPEMHVLARAITQMGTRSSSCCQLALKVHVVTLGGNTTRCSPAGRVLLGHWAWGVQTCLYRACSAAAPHCHRSVHRPWLLRTQQYRSAPAKAGMLTHLLRVALCGEPLIIGPCIQGTSDAWLHTALLNCQGGTTGGPVLPTAHYQARSPLNTPSTSLGGGPRFVCGALTYTCRTATRVVACQ